MENPYRLLGAEVSYYSGKVRAYLRYKGVPFEETPATRRVYKELILPRVGWAVIPVVITPEDDTLQDSTEIIDALEQRFPQPSVYPTTAKQRLAALLLEVYGDEWLVLPAMHYRWNHCRDWTLLEFGRLSLPGGSEEEQRAVGERIAGPFAGALPFLGVFPETTPAIETSYEALLGELDAHFAHYPYLFGSRPSIGDFGLIGPLYAHLYRDPYPGELMRRTAVHVAAWVERMQHPERENRVEGGWFLADDQVPETLLPVLRRFAAEQLPVLLDTVTRTAEWLEQRGPAAAADTEIPRGIGNHRFTLLAGTAEEVTAERVVRPFSQWMLQRPLDWLQSLSGGDRESCEQMLEEIGGAELATLEIRRRVRRQNFRLVEQS